MGLFKGPAPSAQSRIRRSGHLFGMGNLIREDNMPQEMTISEVVLEYFEAHETEEIENEIDAMGGE